MDFFLHYALEISIYRIRRKQVKVETCAKLKNNNLVEEITSLMKIWKNFVSGMREDTGSNNCTNYRKKRKGGMNLERKFWER
jgi:hypothetical protein